MLGFIFAGDEDVVDVNEHARKVTEKTVHKTLKRFRSVTMAELHSIKLEEAERTGW